ncbi:MAG: hypothetical protein ABL888_20445, partial [Pirellulaceae bacterium]
MAISAPAPAVNHRSIAIRTRCWMLMVAVSFLIQCACIAHADEPVSLLQFCSDDFHGGVVVRLDKLRESERYRILPLDILIPSAFFIDRFDSDVSEIAVFLKDSSDLKLSPKLEERYEVAAVARMRQPLSNQNLQQLLTQWALRATPWQKVDAVPLDEVQLDGRTCYRVPSGTLLNSRRRFAALSLTDREGKKSETGINVGGSSPHKYIEGGTQAKAVFAFDQLSESDLIGNSLAMDLQLHLFLAKRTEHEYSRAELYLRQPGGKLRSEPIAFDAKSFSSQRVTFPRRIAALDIQGSKHEVDLLDDFADGGAIEVVLECKDKGAYIGVTADGLSLKNEAFEYIGIEGHHLIVAQSLETLKKMLSKNGGALSKKLEQGNHHQITAAFDIRSASDLTGLKHFLNSLHLAKAAECLPDSITAGTFSMTMVEEIVMKAEIRLPESDGQKLIARVAQQLDVSRLNVREGASNAILERDAIASLVRSRFQEFSGTFPDESIDRKILQSHLKSLVDRLFNSVQTEVRNDRVSLRFSWPVKQRVGELDELERGALAALLDSRAEHLKRQLHFVRSVEILHRLTRLFPKEQSLWERVAHGITFNISSQFDGYEAKYFWVRQGINVLLDGAEQNPESVDLVWIAATFIEIKFGRADEASEFRKLFAKDTELHRRLQRYGNIDRARNRDGEVDCFLIAGLMFEYCVREAAQSAASSIPPFLVASQPVVSAAVRARALDREGKVEDAAVQWKKVEELCEGLGKKEIQF